MALNPKPNMGRGKGMGQVVHCQGMERKLVEDTSNFSPREECQSGSTMEKEVQKITKLELKRIDPSLRSKRTESEEEDCPQAEDGSHLETDMQVEQGVATTNFYGTQFLDWLRINCRSMQHCDAADLDWAILFPIAVWVLWLHRNSTIFGKANIHKDLKAESLAKAAEMAYMGIIEKHKQIKAKIQVRWLPPSLNWFKVNSDGSSMGNPGLAGGGVLIRNQDGEWVKGYARSIGCATSVAAELWALRDGIRLCISLKLPAVVFELDAKLVVDLLKKDMEKSNSIDVLVADCKEGLKEIPMVRIQHCYREANKCADALARRGALMDQDFTIFLNPPSDVVFLLSLDSAGTLYDQLVTSGLEVF
ncbi:hypothetical protein SO802_003384 [Lithocarpus litseifolius]|uniref:RNase H type-1 domain-containing protein n=1 Tax=Lithocarpus litseifolius TaxID=425828 RepID=A0AAW2E409_9ROSI